MIHNTAYAFVNAFSCALKAGCSFEKTVYSHKVSWQISHAFSLFTFAFILNAKKHMKLRNAKNDCNTQPLILSHILFRPYFKTANFADDPSRGAISSPIQTLCRIYHPAFPSYGNAAFWLNLQNPRQFADIDNQKERDDCTERSHCNTFPREISV